MSQDRLLNTLLQLVAIPSPSRRERAVADYVLSKLTRMGYHPFEDEAGREVDGDAGNVLLQVPAKGGCETRLLLSAHLDTVETGERPVKARVDGDWVASDGETILGADDKAGVAVLLELARKLKESKRPHPEILFAFTVGEERECSGAGALDSRHYEDFDAGVVLDYSDPAKLVVAAPTKVTVRLDVRGRGGHAGFPEHTLNAAHILSRAIARLPQGRLDAHTTANIGVLRAGTAVNIVPDRATAEYEIRSHRRELMDFHLKHVLGIIESTIRASRLPPEFVAGPDGKEMAKPAVNSWVDAEVAVSYEGYSLEAGSPAVKLLVPAFRKVLGREPELLATQGGSDANIFNARGLPTAVLGCGFRDIHSAEERLFVPDMRAALDILWHLCSDS